MLRRSPLTVALSAAAITVALSGCATFSNAREVADVDGSAISTDRYQDYSQVYFERADAFGTAAPSNGGVDAEQSRFLLAAMIRQQLFRNFTDARGIDVTSARNDFTTNVLRPSQLGELDLPDTFFDLIADIDAQMISTSLQDAAAPNVDQLRAMYTNEPTSIGLVCVRHILVATEAEADAVLDELADGADFATLAEERSLDPSAVGVGGAIQSPDSPCIPLETVVQGFDPLFAAGLLDAQEGAPTEPVESSRGWHVILVRPWAEISDAVEAFHQDGTSGKLLFDGYAATAGVEVNPRYGAWNPLTASVDELG
ncbi:MAG: peptidylprolyl isomerase [Ilumatobacteraceae bacterium]